MRPSRRLLITTDAVGGVWQYTMDLAAAVRPLNWEVVVVTLGPKLRGAYREAARKVADLIETDLPLDWLARHPDEVLACGAGVARIAAREGADLVQLNQPALAAHRPFPCPTVSVLHSCVASWWASVEKATIPPTFVWQRDLVARGLANSDRRICPSHALAAQAERLYGVSFDVVHNGRTPNLLERRVSAPFAFTAGRLWDRGKDVATLERVASRSDLPFQAAGPVEGPGGERICLDHVKHLGSLDAQDLAAVLAHRPIFVSAALYEPFGLAVLEAAQAGCPLVLSDIASFRELWNGDAIFVAPGDAAGFALAVEQLRADARLRAVLGRRAQRRAAAYTAAAMAGRMVGHYSALLDDRVSEIVGRQAEAVG